MLIVRPPHLLFAPRITLGRTLIVEYSGSAPLVALRYGAGKLATIRMWRAHGCRSVCVAISMGRGLCASHGMISWGEKSS